MTDLSRIKELRHVLLAATSHEDVLTRSMVVLDEYASLIERIEQLESALIDAGSHLAAAVSLLERGGKAAKKAAPSDKMFDQMVRDYQASLERTRHALKQENPT